MERNWTKVGVELVERVGGREAVEAEIDRLEWELLPDGGTITTGFMQGHAINACIRDLAIPKVSGAATNGGFSIQTSAEVDGFHPGFYGIEGNYRNGRARIYVLDDGVSVTPLVSDFTPAAELAETATDERDRAYWTERVTA